ncbi:fatty acyl-AMP ligase [Labrys monachus]|uniref:Fatty-acyl-CoA synthase n=1 Tax=Labrys monachus TaxID=217067 RepID=A0ABU0FL53_9HYPH|nr:fatty acyl-AMP ligase [Labrys monachus]MDQ0395338.1 fatty-acyl-CoA synthase [Labrys monachus]
MIDEREQDRLPERLADFQTLWEGLDYAARSEAGLRFYSSRGEMEQALSYRDLHVRASATARRLGSLGYPRGSRVGLIAATGPDFLAAFYGCQYAGLVPCPLPHTVYMGGREAYKARIAALLRAADASLALATGDLLSLVQEAGRLGWSGHALSYGALAERPDIGDLAPFAPDEDAYIQFSSGSTASPKGVRIGQRAILANTRAILTEAMRLTPADRSFSWLPFYHDMGLVGFSIAPMLGQCPVDYLATSSFARRPALWLKLMSDNATTITYAPGFGYELAVRRLGSDETAIDLSHLRIAGVGGDMIRADSLKAFAAALATSGFSEKAFLPSYGMAEATLAISFARSEGEIPVDRVDRSALEGSHRAVPASGPEARLFTICGKPLDGHDIVIVDRAGSPVADRVIGRILVRGPSLMTGYVADAQAGTPAIGPDGFFDTGDLGYRFDGDLVVTGRAKDLILHNGRNIWPQDVEWAIEQLPGLRPGSVAAFAVETADGRDELTVLVECSLAAALERSGRRRDVATAIASSQGVAAHVVLVRPGSLPFTSSGKLSRAGAKALYLSGNLVGLD